MKLLLDVKDDKAAFFIELLRNFNYVKATSLNEANELFFNELKEAIEDVKLIKAGKITGRPAEELLNEL